MAYSESEFDLTLESKRNNRVVNVFVSGEKNGHFGQTKWNFQNIGWKLENLKNNIL